MKKRIWLSLGLVLTFVLLAGLIAYPYGNHGNNGGKNHCSLAMKGVKVETTNIANGITMKITSDDPEVVKQIQEYKANCKCERMKGVQCEVTKLSHGVTVTITSDDAEVVKEIQKLQSCCMKNCPKECYKECLGAHKSGKCPGHMGGGCQHGHK